MNENPSASLLPSQFEVLARIGQLLARSLDAPQSLREVLRTLGPIWSSGSLVQGLPGGDVWPHRWAGAACGDGGDDQQEDGAFRHERWQ